MEDEQWSFAEDIKRYERLLAQVKARKFGTSGKIGWPSKEEFEQQIGRLEEILAQLRDAARLR